MLRYKQMNRSSSFRLASEKGHGLLSDNFTNPLIYRDHQKKIYYTIVNIVVLRFIGCPRCARGVPKTSVGIIVHK